MWQLLAVTLACAILAFTPAVHAISIRSDTSTINLKTGHREHAGSVVVTDGAFRLDADRLVEYRENGVLLKVEAFGEPARFKQEPVQEEGLSHGQAREIEYIPASRRIKLRRYKVTDTDGNTMSGRTATYILK